MSDCNKCIHFKLCEKAKHVENYRIKSECSDFMDMTELERKWIEEGHKILDEKYWAEWDEIVPIRLNDLYEGMELEACLAIVKPLNEGCWLDEAYKIIESQGHSGMSFSLVMAMVYHFCDRGEAFAKYVNHHSKE